MFRTHIFTVQALGIMNYVSTVESCEFKVLGLTALEAYGQMKLSCYGIWAQGLYVLGVWG